MKREKRRAKEQKKLVMLESECPCEEAHPHVNLSLFCSLFFVMHLLVGVGEIKKEKKRGERGRSL